MFCPNCKSPADDNSNYCAICGSPLPRRFCNSCGNQLVGGGKAPHKRIMELVLIAIVVLFFVWFFSGKGSSALQKKRLQFLQVAQTQIKEQGQEKLSYLQGKTSQIKEGAAGVAKETVKNATEDLTEAAKEEAKKAATAATAAAKEEVKEQIAEAAALYKISSEQDMDFMGRLTKEIYLVFPSYTPRFEIQRQTKDLLLRRAKDKPEMMIVATVLDAEVADLKTAELSDHFLGKLLYLDTNLNPEDQIPPDFQSLGDSVYVSWG